VVEQTDLQEIGSELRFWVAALIQCWHLY
jgi:hypothetical protein